MHSRGWIWYKFLFQVILAAFVLETFIVKFIFFNTNILLERILLLTIYLNFWKKDFIERNRVSPMPHTVVMPFELHTLKFPRLKQTSLIDWLEGVATDQACHAPDSRAWPQGGAVDSTLWP
jgi:hypothetical protein